MANIRLRKTNNTRSRSGDNTNNTKHLNTINMKIIAQFEKGTFWQGRDGYRVISSSCPQYPEGTRFDWSKAMYEAQRDGFKLELTLIH